MSKEIAALIERLSNATEGNEALNVEIAAAVGWTGTIGGMGGVIWRAPDGVERRPDFTRSVDAALALVPEGFGWEVGADNIEGTMDYGASVNYVAAAGTTAALALCIASLRARIASNGA
jgi:hypothetical protein